MDSNINRNAPPSATLASATTAFLCTDCTRRCHYPVYHDYNTNYLVHGKYIPQELYCPICADNGLQHAHTIHWHLETVVSPLERVALSQKYGVPFHFNKEVPLESSPLDSFTEQDADFISAALESDSEDGGQDCSNYKDPNPEPRDEPAQGEPQPIPRTDPSTVSTAPSNLRKHPSHQHAAVHPR
mmetsp:Transcript_17495/g.23047  ORF Transcript_17495/g.23047 Transcript_17495/m.23047 type:complete len:185 (+) Transcript_17495:270-824(+)